MTTLGYVVIEWNQASHQPDLADLYGMFDTEDEARTQAAALLAQAQHIGRRERYTVAEVTDTDGGE